MKAYGWYPRAGSIGAVALVFCVLAGGQDRPRTPERTPLNPRFLEYRAALRDGKVSFTTADGYWLGLVPTAVDDSYLSLIPFSLADVLGSTPLPANYDLRTLGRLTPVKDQGPCGSCWTFATIGSIESTLLPGESRTFSENNLKDNRLWDGALCGGGNYIIATAYMARWAGPVNISDDPYSPSDVNSSPVRTTPQKHIQDVLVIPHRTSDTDNDNIKRAVMAYGGVEMAIFIDTPYYNQTNKSYYYPAPASGQPKSQDHAVTVVGWDDNYDRNRFTNTPPGNGAFIIKNSWGTGWGEAGFFYLSYYDAVAGRQSPMTSFYGVELTSNWSRQYQYDDFGLTGYRGFSSDTAWFANEFTAQDTESIGAVAFWVAAPNAAYSISVYTGVQDVPTSGQLAGAATTGTSATAGYHTFKLNNPVSVTPGMRFAVVVKLQTPSFNTPAPVSYAVDGSTSAATAHPGNGFISSNGTTWKDVTTIESTESVCLKAFSNKSGSGNVSVTIATNPPGQPIAVDGTAYSDTKVFNWATGSSHTIASASTQGSGGIRYAFANWSDGGAASHSITISQGGNYTANLTTQYLLTANASPSAGGSVAATPKSTDGYYNSGAAVQLSATANSNYVFDSWRGGATGTANPASVTLSQPLTVTANFRTTTATTIATNPPGLSVTVDGAAYAAPHNFDWTIPGSHTVAIASPQGTGTRYVFANWSDSGAQNHTLNVTSSGKTYTANFTAQYQLTSQVTPAGSGTVTASPSSSDGYYASGTTVSLTAAAGKGYSFSAWGGALSGATNPQQVAMGGPRAATASFGAAASGVSNDEIAGATAIGALPYSGTQSTSGATSNSKDPTHSCTGSPDARSVWFKYTPDFNGILNISTPGSGYDTVLSVYSGANGDELACNDDANELTSTSAVTVSATSGQAVYIEVTAYGSTGIGGNLALNVTGKAIAAAKNDELSTAALLPQPPSEVSAVTRYATSNQTDPNHSCTGSEDGKTVWYKFVASYSGRLRVNTLGSDYDTVLTGYSGVTGDELDCNDDIDDSTTQSEIEIPVEQGTTYYIEVSSWNDTAGGTLVLNSMSLDVPPHNDTLDNALKIPSLPLTVEEDVTDATEDGDDPAHSCTNDSDLRTVWFWYTADFTGTLRLNTFGSEYDTVLSVYDGQTGDELDCNDDAADDTFQSAIDLSVKKGNTYIIEVSEYDDEYASGGRLFLNAVGSTQPLTANHASCCGAAPSPARSPKAAKTRPQPRTRTLRRLVRPGETKNIANPIAVKRLR